MNSTGFDSPPPLLNERAEPGAFSRWLLPAAIFALLAIAAGVLFFFDPHHSSIYPLCILHQLTGLNCPGCGSLRALHELLHGHPLAALHANAFLMLTLALVAWPATRFFLRYCRSGSIGPADIRTAWVWIWLGVMVTFTVLRNIPAFSWLSP